MKNLDNYLFRCSQLHYLTTGNIGLSNVQKSDLETLLQRQELAKIGDAKPLTVRMEENLKKLLDVKNNPELPKGMHTELRKIYRAETFNRNFVFTNKYTQKGITQEEEAITTYQNYRKQILGENTFFTKNTERLSNDWITGEPDLSPIMLGKLKTGFDTKCSWNLDSFPFKDDELLSNYDWQNHGYMWLTDSDQWVTVYVLVNCSEHQLQNEKLKWFYAYEMPNDADHKYWDDYMNKLRDVEKMMIFDYDRFVKVNPFHDMVISKDEWHGEGYDIPLKDRVVEKFSHRDESKITFLKERILEGRKYFKNLR